MNRVSILDCTLRDGGYINHWEFGKEHIQEIIANLENANIDIIECGFLRNTTYNENIAVYSDTTQITTLIKRKKSGCIYVGMIALGDISANDLTPCNNQSIDGIRLTFHKNDWNKAKEECLILKDKGYKVFVQPVGTTTYSDQELLDLVCEINKIQPFAFYLVDTLGILYAHELLRMFALVDHNLDVDIRLGIHSHNNLQCSFGNAVELLRQPTKRKIIIDTSVFGMGRGAGNLPTELLAEFINLNITQKYSIIPILTIADRYLKSIFLNNQWGYDLPYLISAQKNCHPNYAAYLMKKETLNIEAIYKIISLLPENEKSLFNPILIEQLYLKYQGCFINDSIVRKELSRIIGEKEVLILSPGYSIYEYKADILHYINKQHPFVISVNFYHDCFPINATFVSNQKRIIDLVRKKPPFIVATSNLMEVLPLADMFVNYANYLGEGGRGDNAGAMLIRLLKQIGKTVISLAGFDGFTTSETGNYCDPSYNYVSSKYEIELKNVNIGKQLQIALSDINYKFLTPTRYQINV